MRHITSNMDLTIGCTMEKKDQSISTHYFASNPFAINFLSLHHQVMQFNSMLLSRIISTSQDVFKNVLDQFWQWFHFQRHVEVIMMTQSVGIRAKGSVPLVLGLLLAKRRAEYVILNAVHDRPIH